MRRIVGLWIAAIVLTLASPAVAAKPVPGGRYVSHILSKAEPDFDMVLRLSNDGGEFARPSYADFETACMSGSIGLDSDANYQLRSVQVRTNGTFRRDEGVLGIKGRFVRRGRVAIGSIWVNVGGCPRRRISFRARLTGRPGATRQGEIARCDRAYVGNRDPRPSRVYAAYDVRERGVGCTTARELARRWDADALCASTVIGNECSILGASCQTVRGSTFSAQASARCVPAQQPGAAVELVRLVPCRSLPGPVTRWTVNLECEAVANVPVSEPGEGCGRLGPRTICKQIAGYTCSQRTATNDFAYVYSGRCVLDQDRFKAFEYTFEVG